jgi:hypothetical protein
MTVRDDNVKGDPGTLAGMTAWNNWMGQQGKSCFLSKFRHFRHLFKFDKHFI